MTLEWRGRTLVITWLPVASMGRLAACAPQTAAETEVLAALLAGARVRVGERLLVCADCVGAGEGETVLVATGGAARVAAGAELPIDAAIVGILDES